MTALYVDPGLRGCGCALFTGNTLQHAAYVKNPEKVGRGYRSYVEMAAAIYRWASEAGGLGITLLRIELPRIYPGSAQQKGDLNDLLDLAGVGGAIAACFEKYGLVIEHVFPSEWKGQVPKNIMTQRIMSKLTIAEAACVESTGAKDHNTYDAIGIGLHHVGRLGLTRLSETL